MYHVSWGVPQQLLRITIDGDLSPQDFENINQLILENIGREIRQEPVSLLIDATQPCRPPRSFAQLRASQTYSMRRDINYILVAGHDKFVRLVLMLTFDQARPSLKFFGNTEQAIQFWSVTATNPSRPEERIG